MPAIWSACVLSLRCGLRCGQNASGKLDAASKSESPGMK